jgi:hypothetical protein
MHAWGMQRTPREDCMIRVLSCGLDPLEISVSVLKASGSYFLVEWIDPSGDDR